MDKNVSPETSAEWPIEKCDKLTDEELDNIITKLQEEKARRQFNKNMPSKGTPSDKQNIHYILAKHESSPQQRLNLQDDDSDSFYIEHSMDKAVDEGRRLYIEGLTQNTTSEHLKLLFKDFDVENIIIPKKVNSNNKYFAFVDVESKESARRAVEHLSAHGLPGFPRRQVQVSVAHPTKRVLPSPVNIGQKSLPLDNLAAEEKFEETESKDFLVKHDSKLSGIIKASQTSPNHPISPRSTSKDEALTTTKSATEGAGVPPITLDKTETQKEPCPASSVLDFEEMQLSRVDLITEEYNNHKLAESSVDVQPLKQIETSILGSTSSDVINQTPGMTKQTNQDESASNVPHENIGEIRMTLDMDLDQTLDPLARQNAVVNTREGVKTHCTFFLRNKYCDYMHQGCKYSHQLPPGGMEELRRQHGIYPSSDSPALSSSSRDMVSRSPSHRNNSEMNLSSPPIAHRNATPRPPFDPHGERQISFLSSHRNQRSFANQTNISRMGNHPVNTRSDRNMSAASQRNGSARTNSAPGLEGSIHAMNNQLHSPHRYPNNHISKASRTATFVQKTRNLPHGTDSITPSSTAAKSVPMSQEEVYRAITEVWERLSETNNMQYNRSKDVSEKADLIAFDDPTSLI